MEILSTCPDSTRSKELDIVSMVKKKVRDHRPRFDLIQRLFSLPLISNRIYINYRSGSLTKYAATSTNIINHDLQVAFTVLSLSFTLKVIATLGETLFFETVALAQLGLCLLSAYD